MPLPKPNPREPEKDFIGRCMGNETANKDFPDNKQRYAVCQSQWDRRKKEDEFRAKLDEVFKAAGVNRAGVSKANSLINSGAINSTSSWSFAASDGNAMLGSGGDDWSNYSSFHLGMDSGADANTKARYKYPFGKGGKIYRSALVAIRQRAGQQNDTAVFNAAGTLLTKLDKKLGKA